MVVKYGLSRCITAQLTDVYLIRHVAAAKAALGDDITDEDSAGATMN